MFRFVTLICNKLTNNSVPFAVNRAHGEAYSFVKPIVFDHISCNANVNGTRLREGKLKKY